MVKNTCLIISPKKGGKFILYLMSQGELRNCVCLPLLLFYCNYFSFFDFWGNKGRYTQN